MGLTGIPFLALVLSVTLAALVWSVARASSRRGVSGALSRLADHVLVSGMVVLSVAVVLNRQNEWYSSWSDLLGSSAPHVVSGSAGGTAQQALSGAGEPAPSASTAARHVLPPLPDPGKRDQIFTVTGRASGLTGTVLVSLPDGYEDPRNAERTYPVIEAFHGFPGSPGIWMQGVNLVPSLDALSRESRIRDAVVVAPQIEFPAGADTECVNGRPGQPQVETWLARDVPDAVKARLRVADGRESWATLGFSSGGWCAAMLTMLHPDVFGAGVVLAGYMSPIFGESYVPFHPSDAAAQRYRLVTLAASTPPPVALWLQTSKADSLSYASSEALLRAARAPLSIQSQVDLSAGHRMTVWQAAMPTALTWLGSSVPGFEP